MTGEESAKRRAVECTPRSHHAVALVGPRATGKSAVGRRLAELSGRQLFDLDDHLAGLNAMRKELPPESAPTAGELYRTLGEDRFRDLEEQALASIDLIRGALGDRGQDVVLACGGGALLRQANRDCLACSWTVVYLRTPVADLRRRMESEEESQKRPPLLTGSPSAAEEIESVLAARESTYVSTSDFIVECVSADVESVAQRVLELCPRPYEFLNLPQRPDGSP